MATQCHSTTPLGCTVIQLIFFVSLSFADFFLIHQNLELLPVFSTTDTVSNQTDNLRNTAILRCKNRQQLLKRWIGKTQQRSLHKLICFQQVADFPPLFVGCTLPVLHFPPKFRFHSGLHFSAYSRGRFLVSILVTFMIFILPQLCGLAKQYSCVRKSLRLEKSRVPKLRPIFMGLCSPFS